MAVLVEQDRFNIWSDFMRALSDSGQSTALLKTDIRAAINAADDWVNSNSASFNSALPAAARTGLTSNQKAMLLLYVVTKRFLSGV